MTGEELEDERNKGLKKVTFKPKYKIGDKVKYFKKGKKDRELMNGEIQSVDDDTAQILTESGNTICRHHTDIIFK